MTKWGISGPDASRRLPTATGPAFVKRRGAPPSPHPATSRRTPLFGPVLLCGPLASTDGKELLGKGDGVGNGTGLHIYATGFAYSCTSVNILAKRVQGIRGGE